MQKMLRFLADFKDYTLFLALFILSLMLIYNSDSNSTGGFRSLIIGSIGLSEDFMAVVPNPLLLKRENKALRDLNLFLSNEITRARVVQLENERLRSLLQFKQNHALKYTPAEVVGRTNIGIRSYFIIDKGARDDIKSGMVAITDAGLVGVVSEASDSYSILDIIRNKHIKVSVKMIKSGVEGILTWSGKEDIFYVNNVPISYNVVKGDEVVSSNFSNKFPKDVPIGKVIKTDNKNGTLFYTIEVKPYVDFNSIGHLFIINEVPDTNKNNIINKMIEKLKLIEK